MHQTALLAALGYLCLRLFQILHQWVEYAERSDSLLQQVQRKTNYLRTKLDSQEQVRPISASSTVRVDSCLIPMLSTEYASYFRPETSPAETSHSTGSRKHEPEKDR